MRWLYAAYVKGAFPNAPESMEPQQFDLWVFERAQEIGQGELYVLTSPVDEEDRPTGLVVALKAQHRMEPHVFWFPWATARNKVEGAVKFLSSMRFTNVVMIAAEEKDWSFYDHLLRYGMMKVVGKANDYHGLGKDAKVYQTKGYTVEV